MNSFISSSFVFLNPKIAEHEIFALGYRLCSVTEYLRNPHLPAGRINNKIILTYCLELFSGGWMPILVSCPTFTLP